MMRRSQIGFVTFSWSSFIIDRHTVAMKKKSTYIHHLTESLRSVQADNGMYGMGFGAANRTLDRVSRLRRSSLRYQRLE